MTHTLAGRRARGFTLLEIMVALAIFAVAVTSVMTLLLVATSSHKRAADNTRAAMLAESVVADLAGEVRLGNPLRARKDVQVPEQPGMRYDVAIVPVDDFAASVVVTVRWRREGRQREARFETVLLGRTN